jgi:hypothetical protein
MKHGKKIADRILIRVQSVFHPWLSLLFVSFVQFVVEIHVI